MIDGDDMFSEYDKRKHAFRKRFTIIFLVLLSPWIILGIIMTVLALLHVLG